MSELTEQYLATCRRFTDVVDAVTDWSAPSPCEEWTAADVVEHVVSGEQKFLREQGADLAELPGDGPAERWHAHVEQAGSVLADEGFARREYDGFMGPTTPEKQLASFYGFDQAVHRWDLGRAAGLDVELTGAELDSVEANLDALGDMLYTQGACHDPLEAPDGADRQTRLLARMGRRAG
ncbi:TIGR03086 family protein [Nocardioides mangrovicus]|uniref:TIGR03086 family protein n=1 Tax=Nocardioides mangrovicus TaxID=2478913 RepID=A0A3L8P4K0_9ACTN|nr:TIGR03086 family metal-binding protein [Nocardioides mangrovicus]RLV50071.1 TIGR03086 family protein [Nocardioides mangrovicus]